jgi:hypothetical protein
MNKLAIAWEWLLALPTTTLLVVQLFWVPICCMAFVLAAGHINFESITTFAMAFMAFVYAMFLPLIFERFRPQR